MENASEALIMGFSILIFVLALTVAVNSFNQAKDISDIVLYTSDESNYYDYIGEYNPDGSMPKSEGNRYVGLETIIPTLFKYSKENYTVAFKKASNYYENTGNFSEDWDYYTIYTTKTNPKNWGSSRNKRGFGSESSYYKLIASKYEPKPDFANKHLMYESIAKEIFSFDLDEEELRHEPWVGYSTTNSKQEQANEFLKAFLDGHEYKALSSLSSGNGSSLDYDFYSNGFIKKFNEKHYKCVETIETYNPKGASSDEENELGTQRSTSGVVTKDKTKKIIVFTLIEQP